MRFYIYVCGSFLVIVYGAGHGNKFTIILLNAYPIVPAPSVEKAILSLSNCLCTFVENQFTIYVLSVSGLCSVLLSLCLYFHQHYCLDYCGIIIQIFCVAS